jgi:serine/threonine protein kinase
MTDTNEPADDDRTRRPVEQGTLANEDDRTRLVERKAPAAADDDRTRLKPAVPTRVTDATAETAGAADRTRTQQTASGPTGSDWSHPERWQGGEDVTLGSGSVIKQRFVLEAELGRGGMGVVYRAVDRRKQEAQDRDPYVAIKILNDEFRRHPSSLIALQREARKAQTLAHPNVITVHDFDRDGTAVYMTMELLDGEPLNQTIAAHPYGLPKEDALRAIRGMAAALSYAHQNGIVHSDFKPGNVFRTRRGDVKVLDFGIARAVPTQLVPDAENTVFDATELGALTPPYASAEMLRGEAPEPPDDVYALGLVAYELLTGRHPFDRSTAEDARRAKLRPRATPALPRRQRRALAKALAFDRGSRHADAAAFLKDFEGPSPLRKAAYAGTLVALAGAAAYAWYSGSLLKPDVPWESLSPDQRAAFTDAIADGRTALALAERVGAFALNDALAYFDTAFAIHRNNPDAVAGLETVADRFLEAMGGAEPRDREAVLSKLFCQAHLATYQPVATACADVVGAERCTYTGMRCTTGDE